MVSAESGREVLDSEVGARAGGGSGMPLLLGDVRERAGERPGLSPQPTWKPRAETLATRGRVVWLYLSKAVAPAAFLLVSPLLSVTFLHVRVTGVFQHVTPPTSLPS